MNFYNTFIGSHLALTVPAVRYLVRSFKEGEGETSIDILDPGSGQIALEEGSDDLAGLRDLVLVVVFF